MTNGTAYSFTVSASNSAGTGAASSQTNAITPQGTQTITFPQLGTPMIYGAVPMTLAATASSGLTISFTVTGPASLSGSVVTLTGAGSVIVTARQPGDASYSPATPVSDTVSVNPAPLTVTAANASRSYGAATPAFTGTYTGNVNGDSFTISGTTPATATSPPGIYPITPTVAGTNLASYTTSYVNGVLTVTSAATAIALSPSSSAISAGEDLTLMATVTAATTRVNSGMVIFYCGATSIGAGALDAQGVAILTTTTLPVGSDAITATYAATTDYAGSTSSPQIVTVAATAVLPAATTTSLTTSSSANTAGQSLTLAATVLAGAAPVSSGMVTFYSGATSIGAGTLNAQGVATLTITTLSVGSNAITATYAATADYAGSTSSAEIVTVDPATVHPAATATSLTASASTIIAGQSLTLAATVLTGAVPVTSGTVTFYNGTTSIGVGALNAQGVAVLTTTTLPMGVNTITAAYPATTDYAGSTSSAAIVTTIAGLTSVPSYSMTANPPSMTILRGQSGSTTLTLTPAGGFSGPLTLSCGSLPSFATCTFSQNSVTLTGNNQSAQVSLTVATNVKQAQLAASKTPAPLNPLLPAMVFLVPAGMAGLAIGEKRKRAPKLRRWLQLCLLLAVTGTVAAGMMGCNTGTPWTTPVGTSNVMVVATTTSGNGQSLAISVTITQ